MSLKKLRFLLEMGKYPNKMSDISHILLGKSIQKVFFQVIAPCCLWLSQVTARNYKIKRVSVNKITPIWLSYVIILVVKTLAFLTTRINKLM